MYFLISLWLPKAATSVRESKSLVQTFKEDLLNTMIVGNFEKIQHILGNLEGYAYIQEGAGKRKDLIHLNLAGLSKQKMKAKAALGAS